MKDELKVVRNKLPPGVPRMLRRTEEQASVIDGAEDRGTQREKSVVVTRSVKIPSMLRRENKTVERKLNTAERKKREVDDEKRLKDEE